MTKRTARKDCNYIIYEMVSERGENYIGLTRKSLPNADKVVAERWRKHKSRARNENRLWALYIYLKSGGLDLAWHPQHAHEERIHKQNSPQHAKRGGKLMPE